MKNPLLLAIALAIFAGCDRRMTPKEADYTIGAIAAAQFNAAQTNWTMIVVARTNSMREQKEFAGPFFLFGNAIPTFFETNAAAPK